MSPHLSRTPPTAVLPLPEAAVLAAMQDCVRVLTPSGVIEYMNPAGLAAVEASDPSEVVGHRWPDLWPEGSAEDLEAAIVAAAGGEVASFRGSAISFGGRPKWWDTVVSPIRDADGAVIRLLAVSRDVTHSVETDEFVNSIVEHLPTPLLVKDARDGRYVLINRAAEQTFGIRAAEAIGKTASELFERDEAAAWAQEDADVIASHKVIVSEEEPITTLDRGVRYFTTRKLATYEGDRPVHLVAIGEDVTEKREAAEALKAAAAEARAATQAKSAFLANMSHEIRTPLNGVVGVTDLLGRTALDDEQRELVGVIRACGDTLNRMLMDVLDLSKIEAGELTLHSEVFDLAEVVRSIVGLMRPTAEAKLIDFGFDIDDDLPRSVTGDPVRLRQILTNLLSNAIKFTEAGSVELTVRLNADGQGVFQVRDTGIGFDDEVRQQLFERFRQADGSISRRFGGTGLGLAISRELAYAMGGELDAVSEPGKGSCFTLILPLESAEAVQEMAGAEAEAVLAPLAGLRILVADDHAINRTVGQLTLQAAGAEVVLAENGAEALELSRGAAVDVILMDMMMPVMDGVTAIREIRARERHDGGPRLPIVMLTGNGSDSDIAKGQAAGADAHLVKPLKPEALLSTILQLPRDKKVRVA